MTIREVSPTRKARKRRAVVGFPQLGPIPRRPFDPQTVREGTAEGSVDGGMLPSPRAK